MANSADILHRLAARLGLEITELRHYVDAMNLICRDMLDRGEGIELMTFGALSPTADGLLFRPHPSLLPSDRDATETGLPRESDRATMTREMLIDALSAQRDVPRHSAQVFLHACFDVVKTLLREGQAVSLPGIGRWTPLLDPDGTLRAVEVRPLHGEETLAEMSVAMPTAIDARHFIPAIALQPHFPPARLPVDVGGIVTEWRRMRGLDADVPDPGDVTTVDSDMGHPAQLDADTGQLTAGDSDMGHLTSADFDALDFDTVEDNTDDIADDDHVLDAVIIGDDSIGDDVEMEESGLGAVDRDAGDRDAGDRDASDGNLSVGVSGLDIHDESGPAAVPARDPLSDDAVFHRNRDQLYHPPEESGQRTLRITAAILTICVLLIILYMLLDQSEPRTLPGSAPVGQAVMHRALAAPAIAPGEYAR